MMIVVIAVKYVHILKNAIAGIMNLTLADPKDNCGPGISKSNWGAIKLFVNEIEEENGSKYCPRKKPTFIFQGGGRGGVAEISPGYFKDRSQY